MRDKGRFAAQVLMLLHMRKIDIIVIIMRIICPDPWPAPAAALSLFEILRPSNRANSEPTKSAIKKTICRYFRELFDAS